MELLSEDDYDPFDVVTLTRVRDDNGEPTDLVEIEGLRQGGMRSRIVPYARLLDQADMHWCHRTSSTCAYFRLRLPFQYRAVFDP